MERPVSAVRALVQSWTRLPGGGAGLFSLGLMTIVVATAAAYLWFEPRTRSVHQASQLLASTSYIVSFLTPNLVAHLHRHWRRQSRLASLEASGTNDGAVLTFLQHDSDDFETLDAALRAVPAAMAFGYALLGFSAAMSLVALWTSTGPGRGPGPWITSMTFGTLLLLWCFRRLTRQMTDLYEWGLDRHERARAAAARRA